MRAFEQPVPTASQRMADFVGVSKPKRKKTAASPASLARAIAAASERVDQKRPWSDAHASEIVGLYALLHRDVYGVDAEELGAVWRGALSAAHRVIDELGGPATAAEFLRFTWKREKAREQRARESGQDKGRIGWRLQFCHRALLVDFKQALVRARKK